MKHFLVAILIGLAFMLIGGLGLFLFIKLFWGGGFRGRGGEQAAILFLHYLSIAAAILFVIGFFAGLYWSKK